MLKFIRCVCCKVLFTAIFQPGKIQSVLIHVDASNSDARYEGGAKRRR